MSGLRKVQV